jgi:TatD DNase family protein
MNKFLIDSHCHLNYQGLYERLEEVLANADAAEVKILQTISTKMVDIPVIKSISDRYKHIYYSVGVHPLHVHEEPLVSTGELVKLASNDRKISGFGETGLDYYKASDQVVLQMQKDSFRNHIAAAQISKIPVIIHTREAEADTYEILREMMQDKNFTGVLHCFTGSIDLAMKAVDLGLYISASGIVSFKNADDIREIFKQLPIDRILIETDSPYLAPMPYRGKTNEPAYVMEVAKCLAGIKNISLEDVVSQTTENYLRLFMGVLSD